LPDLTVQLLGAAAFCERQAGANRSTVSGPGSTLTATRSIRRWLRDVIERHDIDSILDAPCGDHRWMADVPFSGDYLGIDGLEVNVKLARRRSPGRRFECVNLLGAFEDVRRDLVVCRDFLVHLTFAHATVALANLCRGTLLAVTHFPHVTCNDELVETHPGWGWRPLNMMLPPFNLPPPLEMCEEDEGQGKTLALFKPI
jgi:hypothetical protein